MLAIEGRAALPEEKFNEVISVHTEKMHHKTSVFLLLLYTLGGNRKTY
jgi:hypothetical protein